MQLHQLKPIHKQKKPKRIGRGGKKGDYSGRGIKGQKARAGAKLAPIIREIIKRYPKLRGYRFSPKKKKIVILNLSVLEKKFKEGEIVSPKVLLKKGIIDKIGKKVPNVKILGKGKISKKLIFQKVEISSGAKEKILKAGGKIK